MFLESDHCMITTISYARPFKGMNVGHNLAVQFASLRDYLQYKKVQCVPLSKLVVISNKEIQSIENKKLQRDQSDLSKPFVNSNSSGEVSIFQKLRHIIEEKKELFEIEKKKIAEKIKFHVKIMTKKALSRMPSIRWTSFEGSGHRSSRK